MEILFLWVGALFIGIGGLIKTATHGAKASRLVDGEVMGYIAQKEKQTMYAPVIRFEHPDTGWKAFKGSISASRLIYPLNEKVKVRIIAHDPTRVTLDTKGFTWFAWTFIIIGIGMCSLFFAIFNWNPFSMAIAAFFSAVLYVQTQAHLKKQAQVGANLTNFKNYIKDAITSQVEEIQALEPKLIPMTELQMLREKVERQTMIAALVLISLGAASVWLSHHLLMQKKHFLEIAQKQSGKIVSFHHSDEVKYPEVEFKPQKSKELVRFRHPAGSSHPS